MIAALGKAVRAHRHLARLAPSFFDAAVVDRERENRAETHKWMAMWAPIIACAYGVPPEPPKLDDANLPRLPPPSTQRAVERRLAEVRFWLEAAGQARQRHQQRRPHALPTLSQLARLLKLAFDLKSLALGLNSPNPLPDKITYDDEFTDLKRAYGHQVEPPPVTDGASLPASCASLPRPHLGEKLEVRAPTKIAAGDVAAPSAVSIAPPPSTDAPPNEVVSSRPVSRRCDAWSRWARQRRRA